MSKRNQVKCIFDLEKKTSVKKKRKLKRRQNPIKSKKFLSEKLKKCLIPFLKVGKILSQKIKKCPDVLREQKPVKSTQPFQDTFEALFLLCR